MLTLEHRILESLLPPLAGLHVVDLGCGTGRWLYLAQKLGARSLLGIDVSPEMLSKAKAKLGNAARLECTDCTNAAIACSSADVVFCNFVLSYLDEPGKFLHFARTILRPGGLLFLTDVHPDTATALNWRRGVSVRHEFKEIYTHHRTMAGVIALCRSANLEVDVCLEPAFGDEERIIFDKHGKAAYFDGIRGCPAAYVLRLSAMEKAQRAAPRKRRRETLSLLRGGRYALGPSETVQGEMRISGPRVETISRSSDGDVLSTPAGAAVDLNGYLVLPGLINAHDHLEFALFPRMGKGGYKNFLEWAQDIHCSHAAEIARHRQVPKHVRLWWGGIRNVLAGVTTVCHHNPFEHELFSEEFILRVVKDFGWAHSLSLDPGAGLKKKATPAGQPFLIHLAEGIDEQSGQEIFELERAGALDAGTVIIHGLGMRAQGRALLRSAGAGLIWCPSSNLFLFGTSMCPEEIGRFPKVALGSDSPLTANGDFLDEVRCAHEVLQTPAAELYDYVTQQPARILGAKNGEGALRPRGFADLIAVRDTGLTPAETLSTLSYQEVELVLLAGRVQLASPELKQRLPQRACDGLQPLSIQRTVRWIRAPLDQLFEKTVGHLRGEIYLGGKQVCLGS